MSFLCTFYIIIWIVDFAVPSDDCSLSQIDITAQMGSSVDMATSRQPTRDTQSTVLHLIFLQILNFWSTYFPIHPPHILCLLINMGCFETYRYHRLEGLFAHRRVPWVSLTSLEVLNLSEG